MSSEAKATVWCFAMLFATISVVAVSLALYYGYKQANPRPYTQEVTAQVTCEVEAVRPVTR